MKNKLVILLLSCLILGSCAKDKSPGLIIFHTNDVQGFYWPRQNSDNEGQLAGGLAVLKNMLSAQPESYLLFDSGDIFSKTEVGQLNKLEGAVKLFNKIGYSAATLSAADLALGWDAVEAAISKASFPVVISNLKNRDGSQPAAVKPYIILQAANTKIAVLGLISRADFPKIPRNNGLSVLDEAQTLRELLPKMQDEGAKIIIVLSSLGFEVEGAKNRIDEKALAEDFPEVTLILGGNADFSAPAGAEVISKTILTRQKSMLNYAGKITLKLNKSGQQNGFNYEQILLGVDDYGQDPDVQQSVDEMLGALHKRAAYKIAEVKTPLNIDFNGPSPLGVYAARCIKNWGRTEAALVNSDAFVSGLEAGAVTDISLNSAMPFNDRVMFIKMRGDELKNALEHTLEAQSNWPQTDGLKIIYDANAPLGKKIKRLIINGAPAQDARVYSITTTDHIVAGGFGHAEFINVYEFKNTDRTLRDILRWCLSRQKEINPPDVNDWQKYAQVH